MYAVAPSVVLASMTQPVRVAFDASSFGCCGACGCGACCAKTLTVPASAHALKLEMTCRSILTPLSGTDGVAYPTQPGCTLSARSLPRHESSGFQTVVRTRCGRAMTRK